MYAVVDDERLARNSRARDALNGLIEDAGDPNRAPQSIFLEPNRRLFDAQKGSDEWSERRHWSSRLAARNCCERLFLRCVDSLIDDESDLPVALTHRPRRDSRKSEAEAVERYVAEAPSIHAESECKDALSLRRRSCQVRRKTRAKVIAGAGFEVIAARVPSRVCHLFFSAEYLLAEPVFDYLTKIKLVPAILKGIHLIQ